MFEVANRVSDALRGIEERDGPFMESGGIKFNASFIQGGQIVGEEIRLFRDAARRHQVRAGVSRLQELPALEWQGGGLFPPAAVFALLFPRYFRPICAFSSAIGTTRLCSGRMRSGAKPSRSKLATRFRWLGFGAGGGGLLGGPGV